MTMPAASSPCIKLCVIDRLSGLCEGCGRTLQEVTQWGTMSEAERVQIMTQLPERKAVWGRPASRCAGKPTH
jgi:uncharacterized protein